MDVTSRKTRVTFYRRVCFRRVSRREDNGETDKSSCILIVTFLQKLSSQWVEYALSCVYIDSPVGEIKKPIKIAKMSEFIHNFIARGLMTSVCFLPSVDVRHGRGKLLKRKVRPGSNVDIFMYRT